MRDGVVFTKAWVVDLMLRISGYDPEGDLSRTRILEPSCGEGAFLVPVVERLCESMRLHGRGPEDVRDSVRAFDLDPVRVAVCRSRVASTLVSRGWAPEEAGETASTWISQGDFLASDVPGTFDLVIGNPPYIRASDLDPGLRESYMRSLSTFTKGCDIFVGFIEKGLRLLNPSGRLCYICADRWMQNSYGRRLRRYILDGHHMDLICRMHDADVFEDRVDAYPAIVLINGSDRDTVYVDCSAAFGPDCVAGLMDGLHGGIDGDRFRICRLPALDGTGGPWMLSDPDAMRLVSDLNSRFPPIEDTGVSIGIGVATGRDDVFVVDRPDLVEPDRQLPLLCSSDIVDRRPPSEPRHWLVNPWDDSGGLVDLSDYPELRRYLESNRRSLESRHIAKRDADRWYRTIDRVRSDLTDTPKLLFSDLSGRSEPVYDGGGYYPHHNLYWLTSGSWDMGVLGGLLLSEQVESVIDAYGVKMGGGTMRFQAQYLRLIHLPRPEDIPREDRRRLRDAFERRDRALATEAAGDVLSEC